MTARMPRIAAVVADGATTLRLEWTTGSKARADLAGWIATGGDTLAPLSDPAVFASPHVAEHGAAVAWADDDDLMIDSAHLEQIAAEQRPFESHELAQWQVRADMSNREASGFLGVGLSTFHSYKAGARIPASIGMLCRAALRDPLLLQAHFRPLQNGRPRQRGRHAPPGQPGPPWK